MLRIYVILYTIVSAVVAVWVLQLNDNHDCVLNGGNDGNSSNNNKYTAVYGRSICDMRLFKFMNKCDKQMSENEWNM